MKKLEGRRKKKCKLHNVICKVKIERRFFPLPLIPCPLSPSILPHAPQRRTTQRDHRVALPGAQDQRNQGLSPGGPVRGSRKSKDFVDALEASLMQTMPEKFEIINIQGPSTSFIVTLLLVIMAVGAAIAAYLFFHGFR